jgi:hypothetical protein
VERGGGDHDRDRSSDGDGNGEVGGTDKKLADRQSAAERDKRDRDDAKRRGEGDPPRDTQEFRSQGHAGAMMPAYKIFLLLRILSSAKTSLNLLKCMYSHCIVHPKLVVHC